MIVNITYYDVPLEVEGDYTKREPSTWDYPGAPAEFNIHAISAEDSEVNIYEILPHQTVTEIESLVLEKIE